MSQENSDYESDQEEEQEVTVQEPLPEYKPIPKKSDSSFVKRSLEYYENKIINQNVSIWTKDIKIGFGIGEDISFDDFFKLAQLKGGIKESKISGFRVWKKESNGYIQGIQLLYENIYNSSHTIEGYKITSESQFSHIQSQEFKFDHDEFAIELRGRKGMIIDNFGIVTNKGHYYSFGGNGGGEYKVSAPEGYHLTCFGALYSPGWSSISSFSCEVIRLPQNQVQSSSEATQPLSEKEQHSSFKRPVFRSIIQFLTISEVLKLFRLNKDFSLFRYDQVVLNQIGLRCVYSGDPKLLKYISKMIKFYPKDLPSGPFEKINNYIRLSNNLITNPDGKLGFEGYAPNQLSGGDGIALQKGEEVHYFQFSYGWATLKWDTKLSYLFGSDENKQELMIENIQNAQYALVFGAFIADSGFGGIAKMQIVVQDAERNEIFQIEREYNTLSRDYKFFSLKFINPYPNVTPEYVSFSVSGKDTCYWSGHYGPKMRNITMKIMPIEDELEKISFEKYVV